MKLSNLNTALDKLRDLTKLKYQLKQLESQTFKMVILAEDGRNFVVPTEIATADATVRHMKANLESKIKTLTCEIRELGVQIDDEAWFEQRAGYMY